MTNLISKFNVLYEFNQRKRIDCRNIHNIDLSKYYIDDVTPFLGYHLVDYIKNNLEGYGSWYDINDNKHKEFYDRFGIDADYIEFLMFLCGAEFNELSIQDYCDKFTKFNGTDIWKRIIMVDRIIGSKEDCKKIHQKLCRLHSKIAGNSYMYMANPYIYYFIHSSKRLSHVLEFNKFHPNFNEYKNMKNFKIRYNRRFGDSSQSLKG